MHKDKKIIIYTRLDKDTVSRIDFLVDNKKFDNRSSFIRRAVVEYLNELEPEVLS